MTSQPLIFLLATDKKFNGTNWVEWKGTILSAADARGLGGYLDGTITKPPDLSPSQAALAPTTSDVQARPGPKAAAWARLERAQACRKFKPGHEPALSRGPLYIH